MTFKKWLQTFIEEKGYEEEIFTLEIEGQTHFMEMGFLVEFLIGLDKVNQMKIKDMLVRIDFMNGNCLDFLRHCAEGYIKTTYAVL